MADRSPAEAITELLDSVHAALREGDFGALPALADRLEAAQANLPAIADPGEAGAIRLRAQRNVACLAATSRGLRSAQRRLREIAASAAGGSVYDGAGRPFRIGTAPGTLATRL